MEKKKKAKPMTAREKKERAMLLSTWENATINLPFDDALYAGKLAALAAKSPKKVAKPIKLDVSKSF